MHGLMDSKEEMINISTWIEDLIPDAYVLNCEVGNGKESTFFMTLE